MLPSEDREVDIFVASRIGSFKHIKYHTDTAKNTKKCTENLVEIKTLQKDESITSMVWGNAEQTEILIGRKNQQMQVYDTQTATFTHTFTCEFGCGDVIGLGRCKRRLIAGVAGGVVRVWSERSERSERSEQLIQTGGKIDAMALCEEDRTLIATGGEENDLKIWRIGEPEASFSAKNLANDWLQLRRPVWVSGVAFLPGHVGHVAAVCSRHGYVRLYDTRAQRRPVTNVDCEHMAATCIAPSFHERQVLVGFGRGQIHQIDFRQARLDKGYKGAVGSVTSIDLVAQDRLIVSCGLDRTLRVHQHESKELVYKQYLTSKLTRVLVQNESSTPLRVAPEEIKPKEEEEVKEDVDDLDQLFDNMETVGDKPSKRNTDGPPSKKVKPSADGSTVELNQSQDEDDPQERIMQLLRSTEKQKKRMEKKKRQKKAKSVFHNA